MTTSRLRRRKLSEPTIARLPIYQRVVEEVIAGGRARIDSVELGTRAGVTATTVRRDLAGLGTLGTRGAGYDAVVLQSCIGEALGHDRDCDVVVIGLGNLGRALVNSSGFLTRGARLVGLYDADDAVIGKVIAGHAVQSIHELATASVAVLCVPASAAQAVADRCVEAQIHALLNFAPQVLSVPLGTAVHDVDLSIELQVLLYHLHNGTGPLGGGLLHSLAVGASGSAGPSAREEPWR